MSTLEVQIPDSIRTGVHETAEREGVSVDQFVATALAEKLSALLTEEYLNARASRASRARYDAALAQVPGVEPEEQDRL